jgi:hypothetical protein
MENLNDDDRIAIQNCQHLHKHVSFMQDMESENRKTYEYSYRSLETINHYWAGPVHWKFRRVIASKPKVVRKLKSTKSSKEVCLTNVFNIEENSRELVVKRISPTN